MPTEPAAPFHLFHRWTKWRAIGEVQVYWRVDGIGIPIPVDEQPKHPHRYIIQHSTCVVCDALRTRRIEQ